MKGWLKQFDFNYILSNTELLLVNIHNTKKKWREKKSNKNRDKNRRKKNYLSFKCWIY